MPSAIVDDDDSDLRIAFDFDGVLADDESEQVMQSSGLEVFHAHELAKSVISHTAGPLKEFLVKISAIQSLEVARKDLKKGYRKRLHVSLVTARNAPSHERAIQTLKAWGVMVNDAFFLGGIDKGAVLGVLRPHIFFDDQAGHLESASVVVPSVHVPFGSLNKLVPTAV
jgi:5'-nucleotidase